MGTLYKSKAEHPYVFFTFILRCHGQCRLKREFDLLIEQLASLVAQTVKNLPAVQETKIQPQGWEHTPGEGNGNPLQYSFLENSMDRGAWQPTVHGFERIGHD